MIGRTLLHYEVVEKLGEGGMGVVYKARDKRLNRFVVLKVLRPDSVGDTDRHRRFFQEAQAASALNHPNIVTIHDMSVEGGIAFIVMELITGRSLDALIPERGMAVEDAVHYAIQVADALSAAHQTGVIHRDLKPANIMVTPSGLVKLLDFGLAKLTAARLESGSGGAVATLEGSILGTVAYMSPEQALGRPLDARSDLFSFGAVLYEMVTGRRVFGNASPVVSLTAVLRDTPASPRSINPAIPEALDHVILRCLEKDPADRFGSAGALKEALARIRSIQPAASPRIPSLGSPLIAEGREGLRHWTAGSLQKAKDCFERAMKEGSDRCPVYACISEYYATACLLGMREPSDAMPKAEWAARKALEIDPACEQAEVTLGIVTAAYHFRWEEAGRHFAKARSPEARVRTAMWYLRPLGDFEAAERMLEGDALALAWISLEKGAYDEAAQHAARSGRHHWIAAWVFAWVLLARGLAKDAVKICERGLETEPGHPLLESALATAYARNGQPEAARRLLRSDPAWFPIPVRAALNDADAAFAAAQDAVRRRDAGVITAVRLPGAEVVRVGPRFAALVREMRLDSPRSTGAGL
jgi:tRNA A-37 threonylcarbamoyl transferase component Bud32/tetratricopeptide (TPR) repeat protein